MDASRCKLLRMDSQFLEEAIRLAVENVRKGVGGPFGAVIVQRGRVIGRGTNLVTSTNDPTAHAEIVAIRQACQALGDFQLTDSEIYTSCEPCPMCAGAIYWCRPARVYFAAGHEDASRAGFDDSFIYSDLGVPPEKRTVPFLKVAVPDFLLPFREWESKSDNARY